MPSSSSSKKKGKRKKSKTKRRRQPRKKMTKAQFFLLSGFVITSIFFLISKWIEPYTIIDISQIPMSDEPFVFSNIRQEAMDVITTSESCQDLVNNLDEFKTYVEEYAFTKLFIYFDYTLQTPCFEEDPMFPTLVLFDIELSSSSITVRDKFYGFWPPDT